DGTIQLLLSHIAKWTGTSWSAVGNELNGNIRAIACIGSTIYIGGDFTQAGTDTNVKYIARLNGATWVPVGNGLNGPVYAIGAISNAVYIGGAFTNAGGNPNANHVAGLIAGSWSNLGTGVSGTNDTGGLVRALAGCGKDLLVGD